MNPSSSFLVQFKSFCSSLEHDTRQLKQVIENRTHAVEKPSFNSSIDNLLNKVEDISARVALMEDKILGPVETRLGIITMEEVTRH